LFRRKFKKTSIPYNSGAKKKDFERADFNYWIGFYIKNGSEGLIPG